MNQFDGSMDKYTLRKEFIGKRKALMQNEKARLDKLVFKNSVNLPQYKQSDAVLIYVSSEIEVDTTKIISDSLKLGKIVASPKCVNADGEMTFKIIHSENDFVRGMYGISEPKESCPDFNGDFKRSVCFVPALAFDSFGYRLGYGKGYYDRFLKNFGGISVGLCYSDFLVDVLPVNSYDINVDFVVTENAAAKISQRPHPKY